MSKDTEALRTLRKEMIKLINFDPTEDRLLIDPTPVEAESKSGIILDASDTGKKPTRGVVIKVGIGRDSEYMARLLPMRVCPGDRVMFTKFAGTELEFNGKKYCLMRQADIIGTIPDAEITE